MNRNPGFLFDERYKLHDPGSRHPESPARLQAIQQALNAHANLHAWARLEPRPAHRDELELVHSPGHVDRIEKAAQKAPAHLDADTVVSSESYRIGLYAAGGVLECVRAICEGSLTRAFAFVRPPGHHAEPAKAMGFCLFNNIALGAAYARQQHGLEKIAVVDIDLHHGNGTQAAFYHDPSVLYISSHQYPYYPGTGDMKETGNKEGKGYTVNFPLPAGTGDDVFGPLYSKIVPSILEQYEPDLILVSTGFDAYFLDPLGGLSVTHKGYAAAAAALIRAAQTCCAGKICFVLEGGYSAQGLQRCTQAVIEEMELQDPKGHEIAESGLFRDLSSEARRVFGDLWRW